MHKSIESREAGLVKPETLRIEYPCPDDVKVISGFISMDDEELKSFCRILGLRCL